MENISKHKKYGYSIYGLELLSTKKFIGFVGLNYTDLELNFTPNTEICWRISSNYWRCGYAYEAASAVINYAFKTLKLKELISFTSVVNTQSINLMEKLGLMRDEKNDFFHPKIHHNHLLSKHVLYRLRNINRSPI